MSASIDAFLDYIADIEPNKIVSKAKCHILTHVVSDIHRFGPAITMSTETFESFNGIFRLCLVLSNRHAPSHDIGLNMADMLRFKHIASGGVWEEDNEWVQPGEAVKRFFAQHHIVHGLLGWTDPARSKKGAVLI